MLFRISAPALPLLLLLSVASCKNAESPAGNDAARKADTTTPANVQEIELVDMPASPDFPTATLSLSSAVTTKAGDSAKTNFIFMVRGYQLKSQTEGENVQYCNNSKDGQHIHFILDNQPYKPLYEPKYEATLPLNSEHWLLCFLSRSYHESLKNKSAAILTHFRIDEKGQYQKITDTTSAPMLFYSRPKGDYLGKDTANILLDFYPWNFTPGENGYAVKADVQNETTGASASFTMKQWKPQFITGLGNGKCSVTLTLMKDGTALSGPNTTITRKINLAAAEPLQ